MAERLDQALAQRGLARSRSAAARLVGEGQVLVNGRLVTKPSRTVQDDDRIEVLAGVGYVSRGAQKLITALERFGVEPRGVAALDLGASTGGFTQVLLEQGARAVVALDVGHDQLDPMLRADTRVTVIEGENARFLTQQRLDARIAEARRDRPPLRAAELGLVVGDVSFISLRQVLPAVVSAVPNADDFIVLVKPQYEVGRMHVRGGLVRDAEVAADAVVDVVREVRGCGLEPHGFAPSPITGTRGNREFLAWFRPDADPDGDERVAPGADRQEWEDRIREVVIGTEGGRQ